MQNFEYKQIFAYERKQVALEKKKLRLKRKGPPENPAALGTSDVMAGPLPAACPLRQKRKTKPAVTTKIWAGY